MLQSLGLDKPMIEPKEPPRTKSKPKPKPAPKKRKLEIEEGENDDSQPTAKRAASTDGDGGIRRSARNSGRKVDYNSEQQRRGPMPVAYSSGVKVAENEGPMGSEAGSKRRYNP